ncbi:hypothetical protein Hanom_Chr07g00591411 [Helianthus anomalus]
MSREVIKRFQWRTSIWLWRSNHTASVIEIPAPEPSGYTHSLTDSLKQNLTRLLCNCICFVLDCCYF